MLRVLCVLCALVLVPASAEMIHVPVWVDGGAGGEAAKLSIQDFTVSAGGAEARASSALGPGDDLLVMVICDIVGDLTSAQIAKSALIDTVRQQLPPNALVAVMKAQDGLHVVLDPTTDRDQLATAVAGVQVSGRAGLLETILAATRIGDGILKKSAIRLAVLYVTDSDVANYREDLVNPRVNPSDRGDMSRRFPDVLVRERISKLDSSLATSSTPVFILHLAYRNDNLNDAYQTGLMTLAGTTGGASYFCRSQKEIPAAMQSAFQAIASHYSVGVSLPKGGPSQLTVQLASPGRTLKWRDRFVLQNNE